jgi:hypothetical protein
MVPPVAPGASVVNGVVWNEPSAAVSLETNCADGLVGFETTKFEETFTFVIETNRRAPTGMLLNTDLRRVPKSAKPAVPPFTVNVNPDSEL